MYPFLLSCLLNCSRCVLAESINDTNAVRPLPHTQCADMSYLSRLMPSKPCQQLPGDCAHLKVCMQALFVLGVLGGAWIMLTQDSSLPDFVAQNQWATLLVGPAFAAVTGLAVKEGLCYGKLEAAVLTFVRPPSWTRTLVQIMSLCTPGLVCMFVHCMLFSMRWHDAINQSAVSALQVTPAWLLIHMLGPPSPGTDSVLGSVYTVTFCIFAAGKFTQTLKDDIGDKSIFECALPISLSVAFCQPLLHQACLVPCKVIVGGCT